MNDLELIEQFKEKNKNISKFHITFYCKQYVLNNLDSDVVAAVKNVLRNSSSDFNDLELVWRYLAGTAKVCPICNKIFYKGKRACSSKCANALHKKHYHETCLQKYGCVSYVQTDDFKNKSKQSVLERYGVEHITQNNSIQEKIKNTNLKKYNVTSPLASQELREKGKQTCLRKYGVEYPTQSEICKEKRKQTNLERYGNEFAYLSESVRLKTKKTLRDNLLTELKFCKNYEDLNEEYIKSLIIDLNGQKYFDFTTCKEHFNVNCHIVCRIRNCFDISKEIQNHVSERSSSLAESNLFNWINTENKIHNDRSLIHPYELDIVLPDYKLAIEYDGVYWHNEDFRDKKYHLNKTTACENKGYTLFHIFDTDDIDIWKSMINGKLGLNKRIYARKCCVKEIDYKIAKLFCTQNHLQGGCPSKINFGLFYEDELIEVMTFGKSRFNKHYEFELLRLCSKKYYSIIGGASKLFKYFVKKYNPKSIISYANRRFSQGNIYNVLGFKYLNDSSPNYWYFKNSGDRHLLSRNQCQKHKLSKILDTFNPLLSEVDNMKLNGYSRIFDCGNLVYGWTNDNV